MNGDDLNEMGPIDYLLVEWPGRQPNGEVAPHLVDLVDRGLIRILDLAFIAKAEDGSVAGLEIADLGGEVAELAVFEGASSGLLSDDDIDEAGGALEPGTSAALLVFENTWARRSPPPSAAPAASWSPAAASPSKPSSPPSTRPRPLLEKETDHARTTRGVARTAVIAGTATTVSNRVSRRQGQRWAQQEAQAAAPSSRRPLPPRPPRRPASSMIDQLKELGELKSQGILTEEEFAAQKAKLLG